ncbi:MAG: recombinase RecA, partial [Candidatus Acidiferrales bacterium]
SFGGERLGQGRESARLFLRENVDIRNKIEATLRKQLGLPASVASEESPKAAPAETAKEATRSGPQAVPAAKAKAAR